MGTLRFLITAPDTALITTEVTSVTWRGRTANFANPVALGHDATGRPVILTDRAISLTSFDLGSVTDSGGFRKNGAQKNIVAPTPTSPQGLDERVGEYPLNGSGLIAYSSALNVDPGYTGQPINIAIGERAVITKATRRAGADSSNTFIQIDPLAHFTFLPPSVCFEGMFAPGASKPDQTIYGLSEIRPEVFRNLPAPLGFPSAAEVLALDEEAWPYFGWSGERLRRLQTAGRLIGSAPGEHYSADIAPLASLLLYAAHYTPDGADRTDLFKAIIRHGIDIDAAHQASGWQGNAGAGQGHITGAFYVATAFLLGDSAMLARAQEHRSNTFTHPRTIGAELEGQFVAFPESGGQMYRNNRTFYAEDIGKPWWSEVSRGSQPSARYSTISLVTGIKEALPVLLLRNGPGGIDGQGAVLQGAAGGGNPRTAILQVFDRIKSWPDLQRSFTATSPFDIDWRDAIADWRSMLPDYAYTGVPDMWDATDTGADQNFTTAIAGGFSWNLADNRYTGNLPITGVEVEYSLDGRQWVAVPGATLAGSVAGLLRGVEHLARFRLINSAGAGSWSVNYPMAAAPADVPNVDRHRVTPTGSIAAAAPSNVVPPIIMKRRYPAWPGSDYVEIAGTLTSNDVSLSVGRGYWSGFPAPTYEYVWQRRVGGVTVTDVASTQDYTRVAADSSNELRAGVRATNASGTSSWFYTAWADIPDLVTLPPGVHVDLHFGPSDPVNFEPIWNAMISANGTQRHMPFGVYGIEDEDENFVPFEGSPGAICVDKTTSVPNIAIPLGTYGPGTYRLFTLSAVGMSYIGEGADYTAGRNHVVQLMNQSGASGATHYLDAGTAGRQFAPNDPGTPKEVEVDHTFTLTSSTPLWLRHVNTSNVGGSGGGDVVVLRVRLEDA